MAYKTSSGHVSHGLKAESFAVAGALVKLWSRKIIAFFENPLNEIEKTVELQTKLVEKGRKLTRKMLESGCLYTPYAIKEYDEALQRADGSKDIVQGESNILFVKGA